MTNEPTTKSPGLHRLHLGADLLDHTDVLASHRHVVYLGTSTIKTHVNRILTKLELRDRAQAVVYA